MMRCEKGLELASSFGFAGAVESFRTVCVLPSPSSCWKAKAAPLMV